MDKSKLKVPNTYNAGCSLLAGMMTTAILHGPSSKRRYKTRNGLLDADFFDQAKAALIEFASRPDVKRSESMQIYWGLSGQLWIVNNFSEAELLTRRVIEYGGYLAEPARRQLALIQAGVPPEAALDEHDHTTPPLPPDDRSPRTEYLEHIDGVHCCMFETTWNPEFSDATEFGVALNNGLLLPGNECMPSSARLFETSRYSTPAPSDIGSASKYLLASDCGLKFLLPFVPSDARIIPFLLEGHGCFHAIAFAEIDCLVVSTSCITRTSKGRIKIARGMFCESEVVERAFIQHVGTWEIFMSPRHSKHFTRRERETGTKGFRLLDDVSCR